MRKPSSAPLNGVVTSWNPAAEGLYGYSRDEMVAKPSSLLVSQDQGEQTKFVPDKVSAGRIVESLETVGERKDRRSFPALLTVSPIRDAVGTVKGVSTIAADATAAQKKSLDILPAMNDQDSNC